MNEQILEQGFWSRTNNHLRLMIGDMDMLAQSETYQHLANFKSCLQASSSHFWLWTDTLFLPLLHAKKCRKRQRERGKYIVYFFILGLPISEFGSIPHKVSHWNPKNTLTWKVILEKNNPEMSLTTHKCF